MGEIIKLICSNSHITLSEIAESIKISRSSVEKQVKALREAGIIEHQGPTKGGFWIYLLDKNL